MALAYDAIAASPITSSSQVSAGTRTLSINAALGADIFLWLTVDTTVVLSNLIDGSSTPMDLVGSAPHDNNDSAFGSLYLYRAAQAGTGSAQTLSFTTDSSQWIVAHAESWTGVGSVSLPQTAFGIGHGGNVASSGSISCTSGQIVLCGISTCASGTGTLTAATGGTNRYLGSSSTQASLAFNDATATTTFLGSVAGSSSRAWSTLAVVLSPSTALTPGAESATSTMSAPAVTAPYVDQPGAGTVTAVGATPTLGASPTLVTPGAASIAATMGTPVVTAPQVPTPTPATASATLGTPSIGNGIGLARCLNNLSNGYDSTLGAVGDSTVQGLFDSASPVLGWFGRLGALIGHGLDVNVQLYSINQTNEVGSVHSLTGGWSSATALWTSSLGGSAPTLSLYNAGVGGSQLIHDEVFITNSDVIAAFTNADGIFTGTGFNDIDGGASAATYTSRYQTLVTNLRSDFPGVPIIITTENQTPDSNHAAIYAGVSAMVLAFTGQSWPLATPLTVSTVPNVCVLDTWQAFNGLTLSDVINQPASDGYNLHPNGEGYAEEASWMLSELAPELPQTLATPAGATVSASPSAPGVTAPYVDQPGAGTVTASGSAPAVTAPQVYAPGGAAAAGSGGSPDVDIQSASTIVPQPATITLTGGTPIVNAPYVLTPPPALLEAIGDSPDVTSPTVVEPGGGSVDGVGGVPVIPAGPVTVAPGGAHVAGVGAVPLVTRSGGVVVDLPSERCEIAGLYSPVWHKDPDDSDWFGVDWSGVDDDGAPLWLPEGVTIVGIEVTASGSVTISDLLQGTLVLVHISGGSDGDQPVFDFVITTSDGNSYSLSKTLYIITE